MSHVHGPAAESSAWCPPPQIPQTKYPPLLYLQQQYWRKGLIGTKGHWGEIKQTLFYFKVLEKHHYLCKILTKCHIIIVILWKNTNVLRLKLSQMKKSVKFAKVLTLKRFRLHCVPRFRLYVSPSKLIPFCTHLKYSGWLG